MVDGGRERSLPVDETECELFSGFAIVREGSRDVVRRGGSKDIVRERADRRGDKVERDLSGLSIGYGPADPR